jgi:hypothetical protein
VVRAARAHDNRAKVPAGGKALNISFRPLRKLLALRKLMIVAETSTVQRDSSDSRSMSGRN